MVSIPRARFSSIVSQEDQNIYLLGGMQIVSINRVHQEQIW